MLLLTLATGQRLLSGKLNTKELNALKAGLNEGF